MSTKSPGLQADRGFFFDVKLMLRIGERISTAFTGCEKNWNETILSATLLLRLVAVSYRRTATHLQITTSAG